MLGGHPRLESTMDLSQIKNRTNAAAARSEAASDAQSLLTVCGISAMGLAVGTVALFGPPGSDVSVALTILTVFGGLAAIGAGFLLASSASKH
jgi:NAD/NADP transhydrogenase beta subunit